MYYVFDSSAPHLTGCIMISCCTYPMYVHRLWSTPVDSMQCTARLLFVNEEDIIVDIEDFPSSEPGVWAYISTYNGLRLDHRMFHRDNCTVHVTCTVNPHQISTALFTTVCQYQYNLQSIMYLQLICQTH